MSQQVTISFSVVPQAKNKDVYSVVDKAIEVVQQSGVRYEVGAMETTLEGELDVLLDIIKRAQQACVDAGAEEVITSIKIHYRPSTGVTIDEKFGSTVMNMQNQKQSKIITAIWLILLIAIWEGSVSLFKIEPWILPKPSAIVQELIGMKDLLLPNTMQTLQEVIIGLFFAILIGTSIAILMDVIPLFRILINPLLVISQTIPIVVLAPLFIIWFGYGMLPKVMVVILVCFFPIALSILEGFQTVDKNMLKLLQTMKATKWQVYQKVKFPAVLPYFSPV